jgi:putative FmdB family regulatory protein
MNYHFSCDKCNKGFQIDIPMDKYSTEKDKQICPACKSPLRRIIEWEGLATNLGGYSDEAGMAKWQTN